MVGTHCLHVQATKLKHQLTYEQQRDLKADADAANKEVQKIQENLSKLEQEAHVAAEAAKSDEQELAAEVQMTARCMTVSLDRPERTVACPGGMLAADELQLSFAFLP